MTSPKRVLVPLAFGFEEIEAVVVVDVLRRAGVDVVVAAVDGSPIEGAHGLTIGADVALGDVDVDSIDMVVLPGGMPGAENLLADAAVQNVLAAAARRQSWVAAICAAPIALGPSRITEGRTVTCYPGFAARVPARHHVEDRVVVDGPLVTSRGPGTALEFALTLVECLVGAPKAHELAAAMLAHRPEEPHRVSASV